MTDNISPQQDDSKNKENSNQFPSNGILGLEIGGGKSLLTFSLIAGQSIVLGRKPTVIGPLEVDLSPYGAYALGVSRNHVELRRTAEGNSIELRDLGSSNGTFINGKPANAQHKYPLAHGDRLMLGKMQIQVVFLTGNIPLNEGMNVADSDGVKPTLDLRATLEKINITKVNTWDNDNT